MKMIALLRDPTRAFSLGDGNSSQCRISWFHEAVTQEHKAAACRPLQDRVTRIGIEASTAVKSGDSGACSELIMC